MRCGEYGVPNWDGAGRLLKPISRSRCFMKNMRAPMRLYCHALVGTDKQSMANNKIMLVTTRRNKILEKLWLEEDTNNMRNQHKSHFAILFVHHPLNLLSPQESHEPNYDISHQHSAMRQRQKRVKFWWANLHKWSLFLPAGLVPSEKAHLFLAGVQPFAL